MTRQEEIKQASMTWANNKYKGEHGSIPATELIGFNDGAEWADEHPQSPWKKPVNIEELRKANEFLFVWKDEDGYYRRSIGHTEYNKILTVGRYFDCDEILLYMPIPDLPKGISNL